MERKIEGYFNLYELPCNLTEIGYGNEVIERIIEKIRKNNTHSFKFPIRDLVQSLRDYGIMGEMKEEILERIELN